MNQGRFSISFTNWVFNKYLLEYKGNRSKFIEGMFVRGIEAEAGEIKDKSLQLIEAQSEIRNLSIEIGKLKSKIGRIEKVKNINDDPEMQRKLALSRGIQNARE